MEAVMKVLKEKTNEINLDVAQAVAGREYKRSNKKDADLKVVLFGRPDADNRKKQATYYFRESSLYYGRENNR